MKITKPKFWGEKNSLYSIILLPLTLLLKLLINIKKRLVTPVEFKIPVICVGNIYIGGTGKTPLSVLISNEILKLGKKPSIVRKFYKSHSDEYNLIKEKFNYLILNENRVDAIYSAIEKGYDLVVLDDGFQDYKIKKNLNIICFNQFQLIGNGLTLPSGPLRESLESLKDANIVVINGNFEREFEKKILKINKNIEIFYSSYKPINLHKLRNKRLVALAAIGNPENFFNLLKENNFILEKTFVFPDHYRFSKNEIINIKNYAEEQKADFVMTEKDYFKIKDFNLDNINYIKVDLEIENKQKLIKRVIKLYDQNY